MTYYITFRSEPFFAYLTLVVEAEGGVLQAREKAERMVAAGPAWAWEYEGAQEYEAVA